MYVFNGHKIPAKINSNLIVISACLVGFSCRYDGKDSLHTKLFDLYKQNKVLALCPEVMGGLAIPRPPCELKDKKAIDIYGNDKTAAFSSGAHKALEFVLKNNCTMAILKEFSPSCGFGKIYDGSFCKKLILGNGLFTELLLKAKITIYTEKTFTPTELSIW